MNPVLRFLSPLLSLTIFLMACSHLSAASSQVRVNEKKGQVFIKKDGKESSFSLTLPKGFEIEKVFKQTHEPYEVISYQYSNGEEAASQIQVINSKDMKVAWKKEIPGFNLAKPLINKNAVYVALVDFVAKFDLKTGKILWKKEGVNSSHAFIGSDEITLEDGVVHFSDKLKINAADGKFVGSQK